ncbi:hypothetical protein B296_00032253 [Ensete ventricosum]|uniref:BZIP domain-containing protein n=1 Tax=Ensete ventricosum TaxID=4639 RepID=A0A426YZ97_ENSVE|nr:hypothetical protein B296_00032253 [Ensete ventricosum]
MGSSPRPTRVPLRFAVGVRSFPDSSSPSSSTVKKTTATTHETMGRPLPSANDTDWLPSITELFRMATPECHSLMWSSLEQDIIHETNSGTHHRMVSSSSRSSSSNSSLQISQTLRRTMEEVWKDITVTTLNRERPITPLQHHGYGRHHHHAHSSPSFRDMMLQDFLAGPLSRPLTISTPAVKELRLPPPPTPPPLPQTALSLNSGMELQYLGPDPKTHSDSTSSNHNASIISSAFSSVMAGPPSSTGLFSLCSKKQRLRENPTVGVDRGLQRMIKNRESAARSRARKQA